MIGEIRDLETLDVALKAASTGHLVLSTLHTIDATMTINRILSFYPTHQQGEVRFALANALAAIVSLRLVPRKDRPGRIPACEVLVNTEAVAEQIRDLSLALNIPDLIREGTVAYGMQSFDQSLMDWYKRGVISYEQALLNATNVAEFALRVQGVAGASDTSFNEFHGGLIGG
jgi:twitching motility protein PilT